MVSTLDSESSDPSSNLGGTFSLRPASHARQTMLQMQAEGDFRTICTPSPVALFGQLSLSHKTTLSVRLCSRDRVVKAMDLKFVGLSPAQVQILSATGSALVAPPPSAQQKLLSVTYMPAEVF
ncbi:unnamed protein product [Protopolystoma xenopodis]|uniref:Uncharacterized protein n=1 Tax=Protopolystoma xenopodis TaxID=117903 RepID=A0A448WU93_9PLAT|nr:unnamed protein product [Protopolystoma xenopodis]